MDTPSLQEFALRNNGVHHKLRKLRNYFLDNMLEKAYPRILYLTFGKGKLVVEIKAKFWIENKGEVVLGSGKAALLGAVHENGSIQKAADGFGMSYRHAWGIIKKMEKRAGFKLVDVQVGGGKGKGAQLTPRGRDFLEKFTVLEEGLRKATMEKFNEIFR